MAKVVAIESGLEQIGEELSARGYQIVNEYYDGYVDAILYNSDTSHLSYLNNFDNVIDMDKGAILINVKNKNIDEIIYMIEKNVYEALF